uniref:RING-CH-type domain-containing protein n=1 Tax=Fagus sylvatica TaxID=28930 RepID=A0A2N9IDI6_FAGSY
MNQMVKGTDSSGGDVPELEKGTESESESEHNTSGESVTIVICSGDPQKLSTTLDTSNSNQQLPIALSPKKPYFSRSTSSSDQCRVCQQEEEEVLIDLGCHCRGGLAKAHRSCIDTWFRIRGSNKCEICQEVAANVPSPDSQPSGCFSPLWVAFAILIGGLLLDVLISITLGVSALPINIIIGVIVVLGLGTALRLALEFCHEWSLRRVVQRMETNVNVNLAYHPAL